MTLVGGRFILEEEVAAGASGVVYRARDTHAGGQVALKLLHRGQTAEAERLARLAGAGVARYVAHGVADGRGWLATEWIAGETLAARLAAGPLAPRDILELARRVAGALAEAHRHGIVHGDVKPANLILEGGEPARARLVDFGGGLGSLGTQAPEQRDGGAITPRADVHALGRVLAACGELPPGMPRLLVHLLADDPADRPADGGELLAAIEALAPARPFAHERRTPARPPAAPRHAGPLVGRDRELAFLAETLDESEARAVLVTARAGMGKSALLAAFAQRAGAAANLVLVDDLHLAPAARVAELGNLLRERPVTVVAAARPEVHERFPELWSGRAVHELRLPPLSRRAASELAPAHVVERAGGNPLLLLELPRGDEPLPPSVRALLELRLDEVGAEARRVLRAASTLERLDAAALAGLLEEPEAAVREAIEELQRRELLAGDRLDPLLREVVLGTIA